MVSVGRIATNFGKLLFDAEYMTAMEKSMKNAVKVNKAADKSIFSGFGKQIKNSFLDAERATKSTGVFEGLTNSAKSFPSDISKAWKAETSLGKQLKGVLGQFGKRIPLIGTGLMLVFELPNIFKATTEGGIVSGVVETAKAGLRTGGGALGAVIGQAICPIPIVGLLGGIIGYSLTGMLTGRTYTEKKEELAQAMNNSQNAQQQAAQTLYAAQQNPFAAGNSYPSVPQNAYGQTQSTIPIMNFASGATISPQELQAWKNLYMMEAMNFNNNMAYCA